MEKQFDFSGWATKANIKCSDGRVIEKNAFKHNDGQTVPLVWNHKHDDVNRVLGHALLENREEGVYAYCKFNDTENGKTAKLLVQHGDVDQLSIYANQLQQQGPYVKHGNIRELSLVLAGANPGAFIENVVMAHGEDSYELDSEARIWTGEYISLYHADEDMEEDETEVEVEEEDKTETEDKSKKKPVKSVEKKESDDEEDDEEEKGEKKEMADVKEMQHADGATEAKNTVSEKTIGEVMATLNEEQEKVVYALIGMAREEAAGVDKEDVKHSDDYEDYEGGDVMKHNVFEQDEMMNEQVLSHAEMQEIIGGIQRFGTLKESFLQHGIEQIGEFFPEAKTTGEIPDLLKRNDNWVSEVLNGVHRTPFSRIKTMYADITAEEARAKGYAKGNLKVEEVIKAFKRVTTPTTVYKKQKLDRDDILDITDFDVIAFLRAEMRMMLEEEMARAILVGDGREITDKDHIDEECIRPIWTDSDVYTVKQAISVASTATAEDKAKAFIKACVKSRKEYKGSGSPVMYMSEDILTDCLLIEDLNGRRIYETIDKLASALTVKKIVPVTVMDGLKRDVDGVDHALAGIYVNLSDYNVGADKGGAVTMLDDFDIDYNQQKYLIETRCSGALTKPAAAVALEFVTEVAAG